MTAAAITNASANVSLLEIFKERAWARSRLVAAGAMDLIEAVDGLQADAERSGLVRNIGVDQVQGILAEAFCEEAVRDDG